MAIQPGVNILCGGREGTLGLLVRKKNDPGRTFLLSCWHVLDAGDRRGDVVLPQDNGITIARYERSEETARSGLDAAIAELLPGHGLEMSNAIADGSGAISIAAYWRDNATLRKFGAGTGNTVCRLIKEVDPYGDLLHALKLGPDPNGPSEYCAHGDSGAVWCNDEGKAIGLHARGGFAENLAAAVPIMFILDDLGLEIL